MNRIVPSGGAIVFKRSHSLTRLKTGHLLGEDFGGPLVVEMDVENPKGRMPTFFESPALISTKKFYNDLLEYGIVNIETHAVLIKDEVNQREISDYILLNVIGLVSCDNIEKSEYDKLGDDIFIINDLVLNSKKIHGYDLFLIAEDTDCIVISDRLYKHMVKKGYDDISFEELRGS
jgi:hypothetical protein